MFTGGPTTDNSDVTLEDLYSKPEEIYEVYTALNSVSDMFTVDTVFDNVHGVYSPVNVKLKPKIFEDTRELTSLLDETERYLGNVGVIWSVQPSHRDIWDIFPGALVFRMKQSACS